MGAATQLDLFWFFCHEPGGGCDPACDAQTSAASAAEREVSEEFDRMSVTYPDWRIEELARKYGGWDCDGR